MAIYIGEINESTTGRYTAMLYDETGTVIDAAAMNTLTLTLYDVESGTIINSRNAQDVLNANGVLATSDGAITWTVAKEDTVVVGTRSRERHAAIFVGTWAAGVKKFTHHIEMDVVNLTKVVS